VLGHQQRGAGVLVRRRDAGVQRGDRQRVDGHAGRASELAEQ